MRPKLLLSLLCATVFWLYGNGQKPVNYQNVMPSTPEMAAIAKNVDIPMNFSSGVPQIGIPVYTAKSGGIEVPVSLSYNASGIRVEEVATWVGLGWSLSTGPTLIRTVRGLPDEQYFTHPAANRTLQYIKSLVYGPDPSNNPELFQVGQEQELGMIDVEPDVYHFSALGYSGTFFWNQDLGKFVVQPLQNIKIEGQGPFVITLPNGIKCYFGGAVDEVKTGGSTFSMVNGYQMAGTSDTRTGYTTGWSIREIVEPTGRSVKFNYVPDYGVIDFGRGGETTGFSLQVNQSGASKTSYYIQYTTKPILTSIEADNGTITFIRQATAREDIAANISGTGRALNTILISSVGQEIKRFDFGYEYRLSDDASVIYGLEQYQQVARKRLFLKTVTERNDSAGLSLPPYVFFYDSTALPSRFSNAQDYWGYFNNKSNPVNLLGLSLMPRLYMVQQMIQTPSVDLFSTVGGYDADRRIDFTYAKAGILKKIQYPTGGYTEYDYEPNKVNNIYFNQSQLPRPDYIDKSFVFKACRENQPCYDYGSGPYPNYYTETFSVIRPEVKVKVVCSLPTPCDPYYNNNSCAYTIVIRGITDPTYYWETQLTSPVWIHLPEGQYKIECLISGTAPSPSSNPFTVQLSWMERPENINVLAGGLRVKKIVSYATSGSIVTRSFRYDKPGSPGTSSGLLKGWPVHVVKEQGTVKTVPNYYMVSNSALPLTQDGSTVFYHDVTEYIDSAATDFKTDYAFHFGNLLPTFGGYDGTPQPTQSWRNSSLFRKRVYEKINANDYRIVNEEYNYYGVFENETYLCGLQGVMFLDYYATTEWFLPTSSTAITYSYSNNQQSSFTSQSVTTYNDRYMPFEVTSTGSNGKQIKTVTRYPYEYAAINNGGFNIQGLLDNFIIQVPIKQETTVEGNIVSGSIIDYTSTGLPQKIYAYEQSTLTPASAHTPTQILSNGYSLKTEVMYGNYGNVLLVNSSGNNVSSYVWGYHLRSNNQPYNLQPLASVQQANFSEVAYTSFETDSYGGWSVINGTLMQGGIMGKRYLNTNMANISSGALNTNKAFYVSYWTTNSAAFTISGTQGTAIEINHRSVNGVVWRCYRHLIQGVGAVNFTASGNIDELRLYPQNAVINTVATQPGVGIVAACDANNRIAYYEYDGLGRLKLIRDADQNIIKKICYNFYGQTTECSETQNLPAPPDPCATCTGPDKMCINGVCVTGVKVYTGSVRLNRTQWQCSYIYRFDDNHSSETFTEITNSPCAF